MRLYYCVETQGRRHHVRTALGVDERVWNRLHRRVRDWRRQLELQCGIPAGADLRPGALPTAVMNAAHSCGCACHGERLPSHGAGVVAQGLRVIEDFAVKTGGVQAINVCLDTADAPAHRSVSLDRLFNRVNATAARDGAFALAIFGQEPDDMVARAYERLRNYNPVPVGVGACGDGWQTRNLPIDRIIGGPVFRTSDADCLLQVAGLVAHALLWREEPPAASGNADGVAHIFAILDHVLNRRASRNDPQGVVRR